MLNVKSILPIANAIAENKSNGRAWEYYFNLG
jgi:hypothetical protein